jgi:hypothetical protein
MRIVSRKSKTMRIIVDRQHKQRANQLHRSACIMAVFLAVLFTLTKIGLKLASSYALVSQGQKP